MNERLIENQTVKYRVSKKKCPAFERLLLPEYISNDIL